MLFSKNVVASANIIYKQNLGVLKPFVPNFLSFDIGPVKYEISDMVLKK